MSTLSIHRLAGTPGTIATPRHPLAGSQRKDVDRAGTQTGRRRLIHALVAVALAFAGVALIAPSVVRAEPGITVSAVGTAKAKPTSVELSTTVSANAELTADALVKFKDAKAKAVGAIEGLKFAALTVEPQGMSMNVAVDPQQQMRMMQGMGGGGAAGKPRIEVAENLKIVLKGADKLQPQEVLDQILKVVDTIRDAGLTVGPPPPTNYYQMQIQAQSGHGSAVVSFKVDDPSAVRDQAYQAAVAEARKKAEKLAALSGVKLGGVLSVQEGTVKNEDNAVGMYRMMYGMMGGGNGQEEGEVSGPALGDIPYKVMVTMQFAIDK